MSSALLAKVGLFKKATQVAYVLVCVLRSFVFLREIWDWVPREPCAGSYPAPQHYVNVRFHILN